MRRLSSFVLVALTATCSGCFVVSLHPLESNETSVRDERILGTWEQRFQAAADIPVWTISKHPQEIGPFASLLKVQIASGEKVWTHSGRLAKLGESLYLDLVCGDESADAFATLHPHQFLRLRFEDNRAFLELCDMKKVEALLKEKPTALTSEYIEGKLVLTSKTPQLQAFFREFGDRVVSEPIVLERKSPKEQ